jgi:hypothetical protein
MSKVLTDTNVAELLKVSSGQIDILRQLTEEFRNKVEEQFKREEAEATHKPEVEPQEQPPAVASA